MSHKIKSIDGVNINVEDVGSGKPIVFLHGWPVNHKMFEYQFTELPKHGYRCLGIDLRGFGDSDKPWDGYNYDTMADDLRTVIDTLNLQNLILVGFSMGGAIAIHYMARHEGYGISKLALLGAAAPCFTKRGDFPHGIPKTAVDDLIQQTYADRPSMLKNFSEIFFANPQTLSPEFKIWNLNLGLAASSHATVQCAIELRDRDLRGDLATVRVPSLILHGSDDKVCLFDLATAMHDGIKNSELVSIDKAGHGFYYEEKDRVNAELIRFIASN